jgi:hypothetical protein
VTLRFALMTAFASSAVLAGAAAAGPPVTGGPTHPVQAVPPGPCGYGRIQRTVCEVHNHPPAHPTKTCKKICVAI